MNLDCNDLRCVIVMRVQVSLNLASSTLSAAQIPSIKYTELGFLLKVAGANSKRCEVLAIFLVAVAVHVRRAGVRGGCLRYLELKHH